MKKKVALLLALVMVLAMLPMNVFGARGTITGIRTDTDSGYFRVNIDAVDFRARATTPVALFIEFTLTDAEFPNEDINRVNAYQPWVHAAGIADYSQFADWLNYGDLTRWSATRLTLELPDPNSNDLNLDQISHQNVLVNGLAGVFARDFYINPSNSNARLTVTLMGVDREGRTTTLVTLAQNNLIAGVDAGVTITAGAAVPLVGAARIPNIQIRENQPGALAPTRAAGLPTTVSPYGRLIPIRLVAPAGFVWALGEEMAAIGGTEFNVTNAGNAAIPGGNISHAVITDVPDTNGRDTLVVAVHVQRATALIAQNERAQINLTNLWLIATADAPSTGTANIEVSIGWFARSMVDENGAELPNFTGLRWAVPQSSDQGHRDLDPSELPTDWTQRHGTTTDVDAPLRGQLIYSWQANPWNYRGGAGAAEGGARPQNRNTGDWRNLNLAVANLGADTHIEVIDDAFDRPVIMSGGYQTTFHANHGIIRLRETAQSTLFRGVEIYTIRLLQDGVSFVDVRARATHMPRLGTGTDNRGGWWGTAANHDIRQNNLHSHSMAGTQVNEDVITIMPTPVGAGGIYTGLRNFDLQFLLSVEAGFGQLYGEVLAEVTIFPHGVRETVVLAYVEDPIGVAPVTPLVIQRPTAAGFDHLSPTFVPDITIYEHEYGTLEVGDRIWLYLEGIHAPTGRITSHPTWPTNFYTSRDPIIEGGLRLSYQGFEETVPGSGIYASVFIVTAPSVDTPSRVTFTGNFISGFVASGNDYVVVVGGSAIARNSYANFPADERRDYIANETYELNPLFGGLTYATTIVQVRTEGGDVPGPSPTPPPQLRQPLTLFPGMAAIPVATGPPVTDPFQSWANPMAPGYNVGMLALAVFADWIGGTPTWDAATQTATVVGPNRHGEQITLVLVQGSNMATINGVQHDIATYARGASGPPNSVSPQNINDRLFLPLRFIAYAFDYRVGWNNGITTLY